MSTDDTKDHSIEELWKAQNQTQEKVALISSEVSAIKAGMDGLTRGLTELTHEFRRKTAPKEFNWGWLISAFLLLGVVIGLYVTPVQRLAEANRQLLQAGFDSNYERHLDLAVESARAEEWRRLIELKIIEAKLP